MANASFERYVPSSSLAPYREIMNSPGVQAELLERAKRVASTAASQGVECTSDVRPGRKRAHARATATTTKVKSFRERGNNLKVDRILLSSIDSARG
jgi:hypothetical protein